MATALSRPFSKYCWIGRWHKERKRIFSASINRNNSAVDLLRSSVSSGTRSSMLIAAMPMPSKFFNCFTAELSCRATFFFEYIFLHAIASGPSGVSNIMSGGSTNLTLEKFPFNNAHNSISQYVSFACEGVRPRKLRLLEVNLLRYTLQFDSPSSKRSASAILSK